MPTKNNSLPYFANILGLLRVNIFRFDPSMKLTSVYIILIAFLAACSQQRESAQPAVVEEDPETIRLEAVENIAFTIENRIQKTSESPLNDKVKFLYEGEDIQPLWSNGDSLNLSGLFMIETLDKSWNYGLPLNYKQNLLSALRDSLNTELSRENRTDILSEIEILLSYNSVQFLSDLKYGFVNLDSMRIEDHIDSLNNEDIAHLKKFIEKPEDSMFLQSFLPQYQTALELQTALSHYVDSTELSDHTFSLPNYKQDSIKAYTIAKEALIAHEFSDSSILEVDSLFIKDLKAFQQLHGLEGDFKIGNNTKDAIGMSNLDRYLMAVASLEKWKYHELLDEEENHIFVNIPSYTLRFMDDGKAVRKHNVVVGTPITRTPSFKAKLKYITLNPRWHVPYSISSKEILPSIRKDQSYLSRNGYTLYDRDRNPVDVNSVDWDKVSSNNFKYKIVQGSGTYNSLGIVAFIFPNEHSVFIHDTPSKYFFSRDVRAFSHGCVRLQDPMDMAKFIVERDSNEKITLDTVQAWSDSRVERRIYLKKPFNVYIQYFTAEGDSTGIRFHRDIYGRDEKLRASLKAFIKESQSRAQTL